MSARSGTWFALCFVVACNWLLDNEERHYGSSVSGDDSGVRGRDAGDGSAAPGPGSGTEPVAAADGGGSGTKPGEPGGPDDDAGEPEPGNSGAGVGGSEAGAGGSAAGAGGSTAEAGGNAAGRPGGEAGKGDETGCAAPVRVCSPGDSAQEMASCGFCGSGMKVVTRVCTDQCAWAAPTESSCQQDPGRCEPGTEDMRPEACGACGLGERVTTRLCTDTCEWGAPTPGACVGVPETACETGQTRTRDVACGPNFCNKGVQQQVSTCTGQCTWGEYADSGGCNVDQARFCQPFNLGGRPPFRCCAPGRWEHCYDQGTPAECTWTGDCAACGGDQCNC
jgi:hypothetical protein